MRRPCGPQVFETLADRIACRQDGGVSTSRSSFVPLLLSAAALVGCSSGGSDDGPPKLESVRFGDAQTLRLVFSEAVVVGDANPAAFRLSIGAKDEGSTVYYGVAYDMTGAATGGPVSDSDPSAASASASASAGDDGDGTTYYGTADDGYDSGYDPSADGGYEDEGYAQPGPPDGLTRPIPSVEIADLAITSVRAVDGKDREVDLVLAGPITDTDACETVAEFVAEGMKAGIFLHHSDAVATIEDTDGRRLAAIAKHWVGAMDKAYVEVQGDFPTLDPYLPIPCP
jgi:hypothetical protein